VFRLAEWNYQRLKAESQGKQPLPGWWVIASVQVFSDNLSFSAILTGPTGRHILR